MGFHVTKNEMVAMRDGVELATDIWRPGERDDSPRSARPALLVRLPYSKDLFPAAEFDYPTMPNIFRLLDAGYVLVYQDCRGTGRSGGEFDPLLNEASDGIDTIGWLRSQSWCDGTVGMFGHSYLGMTQWAAASRAPEGLKAIVPTITTADAYTFAYSDGGAASWHTLWFWSTLMLTLPTNSTAQHPRGADQFAANAVDMFDVADEALLHLPLQDHAVLQEAWPWWDAWHTHSARDEYWEDRSSTHSLSNVAVPGLHIGGWFDIFVNDTTRSSAKLAAEASNVEARQGQRLIIGPWDHMHYTGGYHDRQFGVSSALTSLDLTQTYIDFFGTHLRGARPMTDEQPVKIFVMGIDEWRSERAWPLPDTRFVDYFLSSQSSARSRHGDGGLSPSIPAQHGVDDFTYDPTQPMPSLGGRLLTPASLNAVGPVDQSLVEERPDVLCYSTQVLDEPLEVTGEVWATLFVESSANDTDFHAKLVDVFPDGRAIYLTDGMFRLRYRNSAVVPETVRSGEIYEVKFSIGVTSNVFLPGHQMRLEITSSNFPRYDRNLNTGEVAASSSVWTIAVNSVHFGAQNSSRLTLPIIQRP